jgi:hypothetical protein
MSPKNASTIRYLVNTANFLARFSVHEFIVQKNTVPRAYHFFAGCYRFADGSFMKYIPSNYIYPYLHISAPIFKENDGNCTVMENVTFTRDGQKWETTKKLFSTSITKKGSNTRLLKVNLGKCVVKIH